MLLSESLDPVYGNPVEEDPLHGCEEWLYLCAFVKGYAEAASLRLACSTDGQTMRIHDLRANKRSPTIKRTGEYTPLALRVFMIRRLRSIEKWEPESERWGADPWEIGQDVRCDGEEVDGE